MIEPLTGIGFAIGVLGFLASTISNAEARVTTFRECRDLLIDAELQLKTSQGKLEAWRSKWLVERRCEDDVYLYLWGQAGYDDVRARCQRLKDLSARIKTLLRRPISNGSGNLSTSERSDWQNLIRKENFEMGFQSEVGSRNLNLLRRIAFSLFDDKLRGGHYSGAVSSKEISDLVALKRLIDQASSFGSSTFESSLLLEQTDTTLELSPPEDEQDLDWWLDIDDLHVDLLMISDDTPKRRVGRFRIIRMLEDHNPNCDVLELLQKALTVIWDGVRVETDLTRRALLTKMECPSSRSNHFRSMLTEGVFTRGAGKSFDIERSDLIYGLAHWFIQFWNTPWTFDLCSCRIRQVRLPNSRTSHSLAAGWLVVPTHADCRPIEAASNKAALLGKTLAEIALAVPISLELSGEELKFVVNGAQKSRGELLANLTQVYGRKTITKAIKYCLDPARADHSQFLPEHMQPVCQNILQPLNRFHSIMIEHCTSRRNHNPP